MHIFARFFQLSFQRVVWHIPWVIAEDYIWVKSDDYINNLWEHSCLLPDSNLISQSTESTNHTAQFLYSGSGEGLAYLCQHNTETKAVSNHSGRCFYILTETTTPGSSSRGHCLICRHRKNCVFRGHFQGKLRPLTASVRDLRFFPTIREKRSWKRAREGRGCPCRFSPTVYLSCLARGSVWSVSWSPPPAMVPQLKYIAQSPQRRAPLCSAVDSSSKMNTHKLDTWDH